MRLLALIFALFMVCAPLESQGQPKVERSNRMIRIEGRNFFVHNVKRRETLYSVAKAYGVPQDEIIKKNPHAQSKLAVGMTLLIPRAEVVSQTNEARLAVSNRDTLGALRPIGQTVAAELPAIGGSIELGLTREYNTHGELNVAMLLPFGGDKSNEINFVHFLQGALLAVDRLSQEGVNVSLDVLSTQNSASVAQELIDGRDLDRANLIIGPVYDAPFDVVAQWATARAVPVISPLGGTGSQDNPYVIAAAPREDTKHDKLRTVIQSQDVNVIYIESSSRSDMDSQMEISVQEILPPDTRRLTYVGKSMNISMLTSLLDKNRQNLLVIPLSNQNMVEEILSRYSSFNVAGRYSFSVLGSSRWARFTNINQDLFFKLGVSYVTSYHSDRTDERVASFVSNYLTAFGSVPTVYAMRGYDVMLNFSRLMSVSGRRMLYDLPNFKTELLQVDYRFSQDVPSGKFTNRNWVLVTCNPDYTITVN